MFSDRRPGDLVMTAILAECDCDGRLCISYLHCYSFFLMTQSPFVHLLCGSPDTAKLNLGAQSPSHISPNHL